MYRYLYMYIYIYIYIRNHVHSYKLHMYIYMNRYTNPCTYIYINIINTSFTQSPYLHAISYISIHTYMANTYNSLCIDLFQICISIYVNIHCEYVRLSMNMYMVYMYIYLCIFTPVYLSMHIWCKHAHLSMNIS